MEMVSAFYVIYGMQEMKTLNLFVCKLLDTLIDITIIKPRPDMTYNDFGVEVWNWPYLCVREIYKGSIFEHTPLQETDQIAAINDIDCSKMRAKEFATCVSELPEYITITVIRRKHRYTGSFN